MRIKAGTYTRLSLRTRLRLMVAIIVHQRNGGNKMKYYMFKGETDTQIHVGYGKSKTKKALKEELVWEGYKRIEITQVSERIGVKGMTEGLTVANKI